ncbi:translation initiation factor 2 [Actinoplanes sp. NPDC026623]|uniref:translation initiation factor 2 n=1 Tax=Actinoplanes sp. NPDC026623 TaxID=3155610 RepID=UPI0033E2107E
MNVSAPTGSDDDPYWQRPGAEPEPFGAGRPVPEPDRTPTYQGPPRTPPPSPQWRPPMVQKPPQPRSMPGQNMDVLDESEGTARTMTYGVGLVAGAIALILMCLLCGRVIF